MPSFKETVIAVAAAFAATASAQNDYYVEPTSVPKSTRSHWCADQKRACPMICEQTDPGKPQVNDCNSDELRYGCICADGSKPNLTEYSLTLPYFMCTEWGNQCVAECDSNECASKCREENPCGATDPQRVTSSLAAATASETGDSEDDDDDSSTRGFADGTGSGDDSGAVPRTAATSVVGVVLAGCFFGGFALML